MQQEISRYFEKSTISMHRVFIQHLTVSYLSSTPSISAWAQAIFTADSIPNHSMQTNRNSIFLSLSLKLRTSFLSQCDSMEIVKWMEIVWHHKHTHTWIHLHLECDNFFYSYCAMHTHTHNEQEGSQTIFSLFDILNVCFIWWELIFSMAHSQSLDSCSFRYLSTFWTIFCQNVDTFVPLVSSSFLFTDSFPSVSVYCCRFVEKEREGQTLWRDAHGNHTAQNYSSVRNSPCQCITYIILSVYLPMITM